MKQPINDFSLLCRLFGNLFYRSPTDPILAGTFLWLQQGHLNQIWALATDKQSEQALASLEKVKPDTIEASYQKYFGLTGNIPTKMCDYNINIDDFIAFRQARGMVDIPFSDHIATLFLTASWIEDNLDSTLAQQTLFEDFLLPCANTFLAQVEKADVGFYHALAVLAREALAAMADELEESSTDTE